jgi:hypothetical protein
LSDKRQSAIRYACRHLVEDFSGIFMSNITSKELSEKSPIA